jgi:hypothetical protein
MQFLKNQSENDVKSYIRYLKAVSAFSNLFSDSNVPYLSYRSTEKLFCKVFSADDLSRNDIAYDAKKKSIGIGIKTFILNKDYSYEKIAEFNSLSQELKLLSGIELAERLAKYRNERINTANRTYGISDGIYHCITRTEKKIILFETDYNLINRNKISVIKSDNKSLVFEDSISNYSFNYSKSTLYRKFIRPKDILEFKVNFLDDPYDIILNIFNSQKLDYDNRIEQAGKDYIFLPLYSTRNKKEKEVAEKSGLNQWNAGGRVRDLGEVYIPVPKEILRKYPDFFPEKDKYFNLQTPLGDIFKASLCQENRKALMTKSNKALADWLLRTVLDLKPGEILKYDKLKILGIDSVRVTKEKPGCYKIDFAPINSYETFIGHDQINNE